MDDTAESVRRQLQPLAAEAGVDVLDVRVSGGGSWTLVRVVVDRKGGVDLATCQGLSRQLSARLDDADPIPGRYALEVTSPGTDRVLRDRRDFDRIEGREVAVRRRDGNNGQDGGAGITEVRGTVQQADEEALLLDVSGATVAIPYDQIVGAKQTLPW